MPKAKSIFPIFVLVFSVVFAPVLLTGVALGQCTWMEGLSAVCLFNNIHDNRWMQTWDPRYDTEWMAHYCCPRAQSCGVEEERSSGATNPQPAVRPEVNKENRADTCPSPYDIDCDCHLRVYPSVTYSCGAGGNGRAPGRGCCGVN